MILLLVSYLRKVESWVLGLQILLLLFVAFMFADMELSVPVDVQRGQYTVRCKLPVSHISLYFEVNCYENCTCSLRRVNTFRRNDMLEKFLEHYTTCPEVKEITVVWSDLQNSPPSHLSPSRYPAGKVKYEIHKVNSISNRFKALDPVPTEVSSRLSLDLQ
jgi:hypothetical protein